MSLVSTYVTAQDGQIYDRPSIRGDGWFVCWDDDDPIELVVAEDSGLKVSDVVKILRQRGWPIKILAKNHGPGTRRFFDNNIVLERSRPATAVFLSQERGPPAELLIEGGATPIERGKIHQGVIYMDDQTGW